LYSNVPLSTFCKLPAEILEKIYQFLSIKDRLIFHKVLAHGKYLSKTSAKALSSISIWRNLRLVTRRPDSLIQKSPLPSELVFRDDSCMTEMCEEMLNFFPPLLSAQNPDHDLGSLDLKYYMLRKHTFDIPFNEILSALVSRLRCSGNLGS